MEHVMKEEIITVILSASVPSASECTV